MGNLISDIKSPAVYVTFLNPVLAYVGKIFCRFIIGHIKFWHSAIICKRKISRNISSRTHIDGIFFYIIPVIIPGTATILHYILKSKKIGGCMIKNSVKYNLHTHFVAFFHKLFQVCLSSQIRRYLVIIYSIIFMC